jgi:hypothetical protein
VDAALTSISVFAHLGTPPPLTPFLLSTLSKTVSGFPFALWPVAGGGPTLLCLAITFAFYEWTASHFFYFCFFISNIIYFCFSVSIFSPTLKIWTLLLLLLLLFHILIFLITKIIYWQGKTGYWQFWTKWTYKLKFVYIILYIHNCARIKHVLIQRPRFRLWIQEVKHIDFIPKNSAAFHRPFFQPCNLRVQSQPKTIFLHD